MIESFLKDLLFKEKKLAFVKEHIFLINVAKQQGWQDNEI